MKLSKLNELPTTRETIEVFRGYNHNLRIGDGEFYDMTNLTSADYPVLSPRPKRGIFKSNANPTGMITKDAFCYVDGDTFYINQNPVIGLALSSYPKTLISMGAYVIIMPDRKWVNTQPKKVNNTEVYSFGDIDAKLTVTTGTVTYSLCKIDGAAYKYDSENNPVDPPHSDTAPDDNPKNLDLWIDTSSEPHTLRQYAADTEQWVSIATTYVKISLQFPSKLIELFSAGDGVTISGVTDDLRDLNSTMLVHEVGSDYIVVTGILDKTITQTLTADAPLIIARQMPDMDFIIESENRLWGCKYGISNSGEVVNEIYASKLGDFKNWNVFAGISTDSYVASLGTDGQFTGAITHLGYPLFFKENYIHKVYGNFPANYQIQTTACRGVQKGCSKSLAIVNETVFYKARSGVCAYDGSLPVEMSAAFGDGAYKDAVAGVLGNKYYISMSDTEDRYHLFVYDTMKGMWHREDDARAVDFCNCDGDLYYIEGKSIKTITDKNAGRGNGIESDGTAVKWEAITGLIGTDYPDKKYISRIIARLQLDIGTMIYFYAEYDSSGAWEHLFTMAGTSLRTISIPMKPKRCDHMRLRIVGQGNAKIYSITKTIEQGSDI